MPKTKVSPTVPSLPGPETIVRRELSNGILVLARENFTSPSVVVDCDLWAGSLWHGREQAGLADFTGTAMMRGTERLPFAEIYERIESVGASLSVSSGTHTSGFYAKCLAEDLDLIMGLAADALRRPVFPEDQVERLRAEILTRLQIAANDTRDRAVEAFYELAYPNHPYSIVEEGYPETVKAFIRQDLVDFHRRHFGPRGMVVVVVGALKADQAVDLVNRYFGDWSNPEQPEPPVLPAEQAPESIVRKHVSLSGKSQADIIFGWPGPARSHPDFLAARLANNILGVFGMGGRIGHSVREKNGLAYYAAAALSGGYGPGPWYAYAGVNPANVDRAVELIQREIERFVNRKVTTDELEDNKAQFIGRLPLGLETNEGVASTLSSMEMFSLGLDYLQRFPSLIKAITRDDVQRVSRAFMDPGNYVLATAGP